MKLRLLKFIRLFHLISKEKYNEKRQIEMVKASPLFDAKWYLKRYPDVKRAKFDPATHYVKYGWKEGRNPSLKFDNNAYLRLLPELEELNLCPLFHHIRDLNSRTYKKGTLYKYLPIKENKIVFCNFKGGGFGCNPKYIAQEILKRKLKYDLVWLCKDTNNHNIPSQIRVVQWDSPKALKELQTAKMWIDNQRKNYHIKNGLVKNPETVYIQTWHGSLGIKKIGLESPLSDVDTAWIEFGKKDSEMLDYVLTNSVFEENVFEKNFFNRGTLLKYGHPRNDIFFYDTNKIQEGIKKKYSIPEDKKICLYVPSFRDNGVLYPFNLDYKKLLINLSNKFQEDFVLLIRMHPQYKKFAVRLIPHKDNIIDVSDYPDIQELLVTADIAISDYSSCIFDFMLQRKPAFIYASDQEDYDQDRGFYFPLTATPFPVAEDNETLSKNIAEFDNELYQKRIDEFLSDKGCMEDGHASERVVDLIEKIMKGEIND